MAKMKKINKIKYWQKIRCNWNSHKLLLVMQNITTTLEKSLVISFTVKQKFTTGPINSTPKYLPKRNKTKADTHTYL